MIGPFEYDGNVLTAEGVDLAAVAARAGTPCYVYSAAGILDRYRAYDRAFGDLPHRVCYAVKANGNLAVLALLARAGAGFDIVSGGELFRVLRAGGDPAGVVFSGVGKTAEEVDYALENGIHGFNCESEAELALIDALAARRGVRARVAVRVNPDVDAATHPYISTGMREHKFGVGMAEVEGVYARALAMRNLLVEGVSCHIGSQLMDAAPLEEAAGKVLDLIKRLRALGAPIREADLGGGVGSAYRPEDTPPDVGRYIGALVKKFAGKELTVMVEPGRSITGEAGALVTRVLYRKRTPTKEFVVVDASMTDLIRPALYSSHHEIVPLRRLPERGTVRADIVGPVCETGDFLALGREIENVYPGDMVAVLTAGAYGFAQSSNYNARPRAAEVLIENGHWRIVRQRETYEDLVRGEQP